MGSTYKALDEGVNTGELDLDSIPSLIQEIRDIATRRADYGSLDSPIRRERVAALARIATWAGRVMWLEQSEQLREDVHLEHAANDFPREPRQMTHRADGGRIHYERVCSECGNGVSKDDVERH